MDVQEFPKKSSTSLTENGRAKPWTVQCVYLSSLSIETPTDERALSIWSVSSLFKRFDTAVVPEARADKRRILFVILFDPGSCISPSTFRIGFSVNCFM